MKNDSNKHDRHSIRIRNYDYSQTGAYFVTICAQDKKCLFGKIENHKLILNEYGRIVEEEWLKTGKIRDNVKIDAFIVMPNHFHGIIIINNCRGTARRAPTHELFGKPISGSIPTIIRSFKSAVTKQINILRNTHGAPIWQRNYYEHVVRDEKDLNEIREYIINNYLKWGEDIENPDNAKKR